MSGRPSPVVTLSRARRRWLGSVFATVPAGSARRSALDAVRSVVALALVVVLLRPAPSLSPLDTLVLEGVGFLAGWMTSAFDVAYWALVVVPPVVIVVVALIGRRWRLLAAIASALAATALAAVALHELYTGPTASTIGDAGLAWTGGDPSAPVVALAASAATVLAAGPFLVRPSRRLAFVALCGATLFALGAPASVPSVVLASVITAWGAVALVHLLLGAPEGGPSTDDVAAALADMGLAADGLQPVPVPAVGEHTFVATTDAGERLTVTVLSRDATRDQLLRMLVHRAWFKDAGPPVTLSRLAAVERRALLLVLADRAEVPVPALVAVGTAGPLDDALLVTADPAGAPFSELGSDGIDDAALDAAWAAVGHLHDAGIAHDDLRADHLVLTAEDAVALRGFGRAGTAWTGGGADADDASLLAATAALVGAERAVDAAVRGRGAERVAALLPRLQPAALPAPVRRSIPKPRALLADLRRTGAERLGIDPPQLEELRRVSPGAIAMAVGALFGVYLLAGQLSSVGGLRSVLRGADPWWVAVALLLSQLPQLAQAVAMLGSVVDRVPLGSATAVQFANQFMGLVGGTVATTALVVRYFQRLGLGAAVAVSSGVINTVAMMITQTVLVAAGILLTRGSWQLPGTTAGSSGTSSTGGNLLFVVVAVLVVVAVVLVLPRLRRRVVEKLRPQVAAATHNLREVAHQPAKALQLFGGNTASQLLFAMTLGASLHAFGGSLSLMQLLVINSFASLLGGIMPVPGGLGVIEAGLIAGLMAAGVPQAEATAATFLHRTFTAYLPPVWGWVSLRWLQSKEYV